MSFFTSLNLGFHDEPTNPLPSSPPPALQLLKRGTPPAPKPSKYPLQGMGVGDSFYVDIDMQAARHVQNADERAAFCLSATRNRIDQAIHRARKKCPDLHDAKFTKPVENGRLRVWRTA